MPINSLQNVELSDKYHRFTNEVQTFRDGKKRVIKLEAYTATTFRKPTSGRFLLPTFGAWVELNFGPA